MRRASVVYTCAVVLLTSLCIAQQTSTTAVPNLIRYGGTLRDAQGVVLSSTTPVGVTFAIYAQQESGAPIWMETQTVTTDASGNYSVVLGSTTATGLPSDLFSQQEQRWLGVQVQGQAEQPRVLMVSVPYAFHASEAETLAGHNASEFVTTNNLQIAVQQQLQQGGSTSASNSSSNQAAGNKSMPTDGATDFIDTTTNQVVLVEQNGTGAALNASAPSNSAVVGATSATPPTNVIAGVEGVSSLNSSFGVYGLATSTSSSNPGIGSYGQSNSPNGIGLEGYAAGSGNTIGLIGQATSTSGFGIDATELATSGNTAGMVARIYSPTGIGALILNSASGNVTGPLISARTGAGVQFTVGGNGNVTSAGTFTGNGSGLTHIPFANLSGTLASSQLTGTYSNALTLSNTGNAFYGSGANLTGIIPAPGSPNYIQNGTSQQGSANFNISGNGTLGGGVAANVVNSSTTYQVGGGAVLSIGSAADDNLFLGMGAGAHDVAGTGTANVFTGFQAGYSNTTGRQNTFTGFGAGINNTTANYNTFTGTQAGFFNTTGQNNTFTGNGAGYLNTTGSNDTLIGSSAGASFSAVSNNTFLGYEAGYASTADHSTYVGSQAGGNSTGGSGCCNTFTGFSAGFSITSGYYNAFYGDDAGSNTAAGHDDVFIGNAAGTNNTSGSKDIYIGNEGPSSGTESTTIRIGTEGTQTATYIAGIYDETSSSGVAVYVDSNGQLGTATSSRRFKEQIADMADSTDALMKLRPVTFLYKPEYANGDRTLQYGLIAEEVAEVYPELVAHDKDGQPYTVRYQYLAPMLLNEVQKQYRRAEAEAKVITQQEDKIEVQQAQIDSLQKQNEEFQQRLSRLERVVGAQTQITEGRVTGAGTQ